MVLFLLSVQVWWAKLVQKQVDLWTSMMWPLMFVYLQCFHKPKSSIPRWFYLIIFSSICHQQTWLDFLSNLNQSTEDMKIWSCFCCRTASHWNYRCMCGRWNSQLSEQERCAISFACTSCWSSTMVCLQQVISLLPSLFIVFFLEPWIG